MRENVENENNKDGKGAQSVDIGSVFVLGGVYGFHEW